MDTDIKKNVLKQVHLLRILNDDELNYLSRFVTLVEFAPKKQIVKQGALGKGMYIIKQGKVQVEVCLPGDVLKTVASLGSNDFFGEVSLVDGGITTASVKSLIRTQCYFISCEYFNMLKLCAPELAYKLTMAINMGICTRLRGINTQLSGKLIDHRIVLHDLKAKKLSTPKAASTKNLAMAKINTDFVLKLGVLQYFTEAELDVLMQYMKIRFASKQQIIFKENTSGISFYLVVQGAVQVALGKTGKQCKLGIIGPGGIFGHLSYIDKKTYFASCVTREESVLLEFPYKNMKILYKSNPLLFYRWYSSISRTLVAMLRSADKDLIRLASYKNQ